MGNEELKFLLQNHSNTSNDMMWTDSPTGSLFRASGFNQTPVKSQQAGGRQNPANKPKKDPKNSPEKKKQPNLITLIREAREKRKKKEAEEMKAKTEDQPPVPKIEVNREMSPDSVNTLTNNLIEENKKCLDLPSFKIQLEKVKSLSSRSRGNSDKLVVAQDSSQLNRSRDTHKEPKKHRKGRQSTPAHFQHSYDYSAQESKKQRKTSDYWGSEDRRNVSSDLYQHKRSQNTQKSNKRPFGGLDGNRWLGKGLDSISETHQFEEASPLERDGGFKFLVAQKVANSSKRSVNQKKSNGRGEGRIGLAKHHSHRYAGESAILKKKGKKLDRLKVPIINIYENRRRSSVRLQDTQNMLRHMKIDAVADNSCQSSSESQNSDEQSKCQKIRI